MKYVLDTNIILSYLRKNDVWGLIETSLQFFDSGTKVYIPAIVIGELQSIAIQNKWGVNKQNELQLFINEFIKIDIISDEVINRYAEIDAFSQGRLEGKALNYSARNMGKNDLWIAATASILNATLITTDKDFQHLHPNFLQVAYFEIK